MAQSVAATDLISRIIFRADATSSAPGFTSSAEQYYLLNSCYKRLWNKLVDARGNEYFAQEFSFVTVSGTSAVPLDYAISGPYVAAAAKPFFELISIQIANGNPGTVWRRMKMWEHAELDYLRVMTGARQAPWTMIKHRVIDTNLVLMPTPRNAFAVKGYYMPTAPTLVASNPSTGQSTTMDGVNGFEDWIVLSGAIAIKEKKEHDITALLAERAMIDDEIARIKAERNAGAAAKVISRGNPWSLERVNFPYGLADPDDY